MGKIEIASFSVVSAIIAQQNGADRVELCADMHLGGTTPLLEDIKAVRKSITIDLNVMIRPRGGNFVYTAEEFAMMKQEIEAIKGTGANGFVFGILNVDNSVNIAQNKELVDWAYPLPCTFHRAFDAVDDMKQSLEDVISCGFTTILTSGCKVNVDEGLTNLKQLVEWSAGRIVIMPGGGLRSTNIMKISEATGAPYFHSSAITDGGDTAVAREVRELRASI